MRHFWVTLPILGFYAAALATPACDLGPEFIDHNKRIVLGVDALVNGWNGAGTIPELANVALALGWLVLLANRYRIATGFGVIAFALGCTAPSVFGIHVRE